MPSTRQKEIIINLNRQIEKMRMYVVYRGKSNPSGLLFALMETLPVAAT